MSQQRLFIPRQLVLRAACVLVFMVLSGFVAVAGAGAWTKIWEVALDDQLRVERQCVVKELLQVREWELAGKRIIEGRAECLDGRAFDFSRSGPGPRFDLKQCEPKVC